MSVVQNDTANSVGSMCEVLERIAMKTDPELVNLLVNDSVPIKIQFRVTRNVRLILLCQMSPFFNSNGILSTPCIFTPYN